VVEASALLYSDELVTSQNRRAACVDIGEGPPRDPREMAELAGFASSKCVRKGRRKEGREGEGCVKGLGAAQREGWSFSHAHAGVVAEPGLA